MIIFAFEVITILLLSFPSLSQPSWKSSSPLPSQSIVASDWHHYRANRWSWPRTLKATFISTMAHLLGELSWQAQLASIAQTQKQFQKKAQTQLQTKKNQACSKGIIVILCVIACFNWQRINFLFLDVINLKQMLMLSMSSGQCPQVNSIVVPSMSSDWCSSRLISAAIVAQNQNGLGAISELISG